MSRLEPGFQLYAGFVCPGSSGDRAAAFYAAGRGFESHLGHHFLPVLGPLVCAIASIWQLVAMVIAIRQAFDYSSAWRAVG